MKKLNMAKNQKTTKNLMCRVEIFAGQYGKLIAEEIFRGSSQLIAKNSKSFIDKFKGLNYYYEFKTNKNIIRRGFIDEDKIIQDDVVITIKIFQEPGLIQIADKSFIDKDEKIALEKAEEFMQEYRGNNVNYYRLYKNGVIINQGSIV